MEWIQIKECYLSATYRKGTPYENLGIAMLALIDCLLDTGSVAETLNPTMAVWTLVLQEETHPTNSIHVSWDWHTAEYVIYPTDRSKEYRIETVKGALTQIHECVRDWRI